MKSTYLCFDLGTSKIKTALFDDKGNILYFSQVGLDIHTRGNIIFQDPNECYGAVLKEIQIIKDKDKSDFINLESIIFSGQMAGILCIDKDWNIIFPWSFSVDTRANSYLAKLEENMGSEVRKNSGGIPFAAAKILWLKKEYPDIYNKTFKVINLNSYVAGKLLGLDGRDAFIDCTMASVNGLAIAEKMQWSEDLCSDLKIDMSKLPRILKPDTCVGSIGKEKFRTGKDIKVLSGIGDQVAGFIGSGTLEKNDVVDVSGTYTVLGYRTDKFIPDDSDRIVTAIYTGIDNLYYHMSCIAAGGLLNDWFTQNLNYIRKDSLIIRENNLFFTPHLGGRSAPSQPFFNGTILGLEWNQDINDIYITMLESIAFEYSIILEKIKAINNIGDGHKLKMKVIGGGAKDRLWNQIKANVIDVDYFPFNNKAFELYGDYIISRNSGSLLNGYKVLLDNGVFDITDTIYPQKEKAEYYKRKKKLYQNIVIEVGKIYEKYYKQQ